MMPTHRVRVDRISACVTDLSDNGIRVDGATDRQLKQVVREHLEYFQLMLGYDSDPGEVLNLLKNRGRDLPN
jgi:hypothetical protein